jgi:hypothetical protein
LRPRVRFNVGNAGDAAARVHKITITAQREVNPLVVYTRKNPWIIPPEIWGGLSKNVFDEDITVSVESAGNGTPASAPSSVRFRIAPVQAGGSMIYWAATSLEPGPAAPPLGFTTALLGFGVGEEAVIPTLRPGDIRETMLDDDGNLKDPEYQTVAGQARCVGCHTSTGDGKAVAIVDHWPWNQALADVPALAGARTT